jgi:hypothetical protein
MEHIKTLTVVTACKDRITVSITAIGENQDYARVSLLSFFGGAFLWDMKGGNLECFLSNAPVDDLIKNLFGAVWHEIEAEKGGYAYQVEIIQVMQSAIQDELWDEKGPVNE